MPQISPMEVLVIVAIGLVVFGPQKLPQIARSIGRAASEARRIAQEVRTEFESGLQPEPDGPDQATPDEVDEDVPGRDPSKEER